MQNVIESKPQSNVKKMLLERKDYSLGMIDSMLRKTNHIVRIWANHKHWHVVYIG